jgi:hypothetical protein
LGPNIGPSLNVKKALFFPISWWKIPNSVVIKVFVKSLMKAFSNEIKSRTLIFKFLTWLLFVLLCKRNNTHKIPGTSAVYWVAFDLLKVACTGLRAEIVVFGIILLLKMFIEINVI